MPITFENVYISLLFVYLYEIYIRIYKICTTENTFQTNS